MQKKLILITGCVIFLIAILAFVGKVAWSHCVCKIPAGEVVELRLGGKPLATLVEGTHVTIPRPLAEWARLPIAARVYNEEGKYLRTRDSQLVTLSAAVSYEINPDRFFDHFKDDEVAAEDYIAPIVRAILGQICGEYTIEEIQGRGNQSNLDEQVLRQANAIALKQSETIAKLKEEIQKRISGEVDLTSTVASSSLFEGESEELMQSTTKIDLAGILLEALREAFDKDGYIIPTAVSILNVDFAEKYVKIVDDKMKLTTDIRAQPHLFDSGVEIAHKKFNEAQGEANAILREAENTAEATRQRGKNEASAIIASATAKANGYMELSANLTPNLVAAKAIEKWDGSIPERVLVTEEGQGFLFPLGEMK